MLQAMGRERKDIIKLEESYIDPPNRKFPLQLADTSSTVDTINDIICTLDPVCLEAPLNEETS